MSLLSTWSFLSPKEENYVVSLQVHFRNRFTNKKTIVGEYETQQDEDPRLTPSEQMGINGSGSGSLEAGNLTYVNDSP